MQASDANALFSWFRSQNGVVDTSSVGFRDFPGIGRGAVALQDIPVSSLRDHASVNIDASADVGGTYVVLNSSTTYPIHADIIFTGSYGQECMEAIWTGNRMGWAYSMHDVGGVAWAIVSLEHVYVCVH